MLPQLSEPCGRHTVSLDNQIVQVMMLLAYIISFKAVRQTKSIENAENWLPWPDKLYSVIKLIIPLQ